MLDSIVDGGGTGAVAVLVAVFAVGYGCGSTTLLDRWEKFMMSSWWNLYVSLVMSYVTIRFYTLFLDPILERLSTSMATMPSTGTSHLLGSPRKRDGQRRASLMTAKDMDVFSKLKKIDEEGEDAEEEEETSTLSPTSSKGKQKKQPIDMSGSFQLIENHNFEAFLVAQGLPWMLARAANKARPIHHITHLGKFITIRIEGIIESTSTYEINGEPVEGLIRGRLFADQVTYLTFQDLGEAVPVASPAKWNNDKNVADEKSRSLVSSTPRESMESENSKDNSKYSVGGKLKSAVDEMAQNYDEFADNVKKNLGQVFKTTPLKGTKSAASKSDASGATKYAAVKKSVPPPAVSSNSLVVNQPFKDDTSSADAVSTPGPVSMPSNAPMTPKRSHICGIKTTKRAINDGYTVTVRRKLSADKSRIIMLSSVEFDDPKKEDIESKQIFDRLQGS